MGSIMNNIRGTYHVDFPRYCHNKECDQLHLLTFESLTMEVATFWNILILILCVSRQPYAYFFFYFYITMYKSKSI